MLSSLLGGAAAYYIMWMPERKRIALMFSQTHVGAGIVGIPHIPGC